MIASGAYQGHDLAKLHYDRAVEYHAKGDEDRAIAGYSEAISLDPNYALAFYSRANSWQAKRDNDRAIADFNESIRLDPDYADSYNNRGTAWLAKGDPPSPTTARRSGSIPIARWPSICVASPSKRRATRPAAPPISPRRRQLTQTQPE